MKWINAFLRLPIGEAPAKFGRLIGSLTTTATQVIWHDKSGHRIYHSSDKELMLIEWLDETTEVCVPPASVRVCVRNCTYCVNMAQDGFCEHVRDVEPKEQSQPGSKALTE